MLIAENIRTGYGPSDTLKGISLNINQSEIVTIIGANGAGKSTFLKTVSRFLNLRQGSLRFMDQELSRFASHELVKLGLSHVPEGRRIFPRLTVLENLELGAYSRPASERSHSLQLVLDLFPILGQRKTQLGGTLSGGEQQMLAIGRGLMCQPKLLLLDEPSMGVAPLLVEKIFETIQRLNREGVTILLVEQDAHQALSIAHRAYVFETGEVVVSGSGQDLLKDPRVKEAYLGE